MKYHSADYPITWFKDRYNEGNLVLRKPFLQRRLVWKLRQKSKLIESLLMEYPIPEIFIQLKTTPEGQTSFIVVDGQQRISSILAFLGIKDDDDDNDFELRFLEDASPWRNLDFSELTDEQKVRFFGRLISVRIFDEVTDAEVQDLFVRINKYTTKLNDQEIRNATYAGPLIRLAERTSEDDFWTDNKIVTVEDIRRMRDIEMMSELIIGVIDGPQGGSTKAIDDYYIAFEEYGEEFPNQRTIRTRFRRALGSIQEVFPDIRDTRWRNKTDFYTLFVATAELQQGRRLADRNVRKLRRALDTFAAEVYRRLADDEAEVDEAVASYVRAVEKGVSDKARRTARHDALTPVLAPFFTRRRAT